MHVIAKLASTDYVAVREPEHGLQDKDVATQYGPDIITRKELSALIYLALQSRDLPKSFSNISKEDIDESENKTRELLADLLAEIIRLEEHTCDKNLIRGAMIYGPCPATRLQYLDFALDRYEADDDWLIKNKGFSIEQAVKVCRAIYDLSILQLSIKHKEQSYLSCFTFAVQQIADHIDESSEVVEIFLHSYALSTDCSWDKFSSIDACNPCITHPIIELGNQTYVCFQSKDLLEALYEAPFHWMQQDNNYKDDAAKHRGKYLENTAVDMLARVFGDNNVWTNIEIVDNKGTTKAEIDVLVLFANRALVLQGKSKLFTLQAR